MTITFTIVRCVTGYTRKHSQPSNSIPVKIDLDARLEELDHSNLTTPYAKQKESLQNELEMFMKALPGSKTLITATPKDVCRFLVWKDKNGKTQIHVDGCPNMGKHGSHTCTCPIRLAFSTVDSYIGKLRAIFHDAGRQGEWESTFSLAG